MSDTEYVEEREFIEPYERPFIRLLVEAVGLGTLVVSLIVFGIVRVAYPDFGIGAAALMGVFTGLWVGLFFGSAAAVALFQQREERADKLVTPHH